MHEASLSGVFSLYRAALPRCWIPALLLALGGVGTAMLLERMLPTTNDVWQYLEQVRSLTWSMAFWRLLLIGGAISVLGYSALVAVIHAVAVPGTPPPAAAGFGPALRSLPAAIVAAVLFLVVTTLGTLAFFIPGAWLWGMWQLWLVAMVVERLGPIDASTRGARLPPDGKGRTTG